MNTIRVLSAALCIASSSQICAQTITGITADAQVSTGGVSSGTNPMLAGFSGSTGMCPVLVFQLPTLPAGQQIATANLSAYYAGRDGSPSFNTDVYGLPHRTVSTVLTSDFYAGASDATKTKIQDNFITPSSGTTGFTASTNAAGDTALAAYLNGRYQAGGAGKYIFLRLSPDAALTNNYTRYKFNSAEAADFYKPKITYTTQAANTYFASTSFWNTKVTNAPLSADQSDVSKLTQQIATYGTYFNTWQYSVPVWVASASQSTITVIDTDDGFMTSRWGPVPWPSNATAAAGTDAHCVIWQPSTNKMWEFFGTAGTYPNITARHGGVITNVSSSNGIFPNPYGATATGLPLVGGLVTLAEADQIAANPNYVIPHAIALAVPKVATYHVAPATRHDANAPGGAVAIPEGRRFKLPANYDPNVSIPSAPPLTKALARAVRDYGMVLRDASGVVTLYGEDAKTRSTSPWTSALYGNKAGYEVLNSFPWSQLQVLEP